MRMSKQKLFKQLERGHKARSVGVRTNEWPSWEDTLGLFRTEVVSSFPKGTLGYFADELRKSVEVLIEQFEQAGIGGLTQLHHVTDQHKQALLGHLQRSHGTRSEHLYQDKGSIAQQLVVVESITADVLKHLAREPHSVYQLPPRRFEELVAKILEDQGCEVTLTKQTRDGGYDILGRITAGSVPLLFLAECKRYAEDRTVGVEVVRNLYGVIEMQRANFGMIITTSSFTKDAREEKLRIGPRLDLKEFGDLKAWLQRYRDAG
jgi:restriction system protein